MNQLKVNFLLVVSIVCIGLGIYAFNVANDIESQRATDSTEVDKEEYGGDAYTGIQNACAEGANNVLALQKSIAMEIQSVMSFVGVTFIVSGIVVLLYYIADKFYLLKS